VVVVRIRATFMDGYSVFHFIVDLTKSTLSIHVELVNNCHHCDCCSLHFALCYSIFYNTVLYVSFWIQPFMHAGLELSTCRKHRVQLLDTRRKKSIFNSEYRRHVERCAHRGDVQNSMKDVYV